MNNWLVAAFLALGGAALIWKLAKKYIPDLIDKGFEKLLQLPVARKFIIENAEDIKAILESSLQKVEEDIEQAKTQDQSVPSKDQPQAPKAE